MIVVDTHVFIWDALGSHKLSTRAKAALDEAEKTQSISMVPTKKVLQYLTRPQ